MASTVVCYIYTNPDTGEQTAFRPEDITVVTMQAGDNTGAPNIGGPVPPGRANGCAACRLSGVCGCVLTGPRVTNTST